MKIDYQNRIDEYLLNRMSDEESMTFEKEVNDNKELQEQLSFTENIQQVLKSRNEKLAKMKEWRDDYKWKEESREADTIEYRATGSGYDYCPAPPKKQTHVHSHPFNRKALYWISSIAAVVVAGFFLIQNLYITKNSDNYTVSPSMNHASFRAGADNSDIEVLLSQQNYNEAFELINEKSLALNKDSLAIVHDTIIKEVQKEYDLLIIQEKQYELKWLKVNALIGLHRQSDAILLLNELRSTENAYQMAADSLYKEIITR